jgi:hypothetical protein
MIKQRVIYTVLGVSLCAAWNFEITAQTDQAQIVHKLDFIEDFQDFDEFDEAVNAAISSGMLKSKPEMRKPSSIEVVARKLAGFLLMRYLSLKEFLGARVATVKSYWASRE